MKNRSKLHMQCSTELGLKWVVTSFLEIRWQERWRLIPIHVSSCTAGEMLSDTQGPARGFKGQATRNGKRLKACRMCLKIVRGSFAVTASSLHYSKTKRERGKMLSLTLSYFKCKISCSLLVVSPPSSVLYSALDGAQQRKGCYVSWLLWFHCVYLGITREIQCNLCNQAA